MFAYSSGRYRLRLAGLIARGLARIFGLPCYRMQSSGTTRTKSVALYHWSWAFIRTQCQLLLKNDGVEDEDQVFILSEILRYLQSDRSGISHFDQMNAEWKDVVNKVKSNATLAKASDEVQNTIAAWHQEQRDLCLIMSRLTGSDVSLKLKNDHRLDPAKRLKGDEYLCGQSAHNYRYEGGGAAVLGSVQPQPLENEPDGSINLEKAQAAIKADDFHFAPTRLLSLENTIGGKVLSLDYQRQARAFCDDHNLRLHLDGARVFNAAVKSNCDVTEITRTPNT